jgi:hypothetical protein
MTSTLQDDSPRDLVLYKESMTVKFNEHVIIIKQGEKQRGDFC